MSCIIYNGPGPDGNPSLTPSTFPLPTKDQLGDGEVVLALEGATLCNSDLHTLTGRRKEPTPTVLGHEGCGTVALSKRPDAPVGMRLTFSVTDVCHDCQVCRGGPPQKCLNLKKYGHSVHVEGSVPLGTYASHVVLGKGTTLVPLSPQLDTALAVPANCALATVVAAKKAALHALQKYPGSGQRSVLIFGGGLLGLYACCLFQEEGFEVYLSDPMEKRRQQAEVFGAIGLREDQVAKRQYDAVIEVCGVGVVVKQGLQALRPGGALVLVGCVTPNTAIDITGEQVVRKCATLVGIHNYCGEDLEDAVKFLERTKLKPQLRALVSEALPLSEFEKALALALEGAYQRVLLDCTN